MGVIVERRELAGGHLGVEALRIDRQHVLDVSVGKLSRQLPPARMATFLKASKVDSLDLHFRAGVVRKAEEKVAAANPANFMLA